MVKVYSTNSCPWCVKAKQYLKSKNVEFEDLNVQTDMVAREDMLKKSKQMGVPVLDINGTIIGKYTEPELPVEVPSQGTDENGVNRYTSNTELKFWGVVW